MFLYIHQKEIEDIRVTEASPLRDCRIVEVAYGWNRRSMAAILIRME